MESFWRWIRVNLSSLFGKIARNRISGLIQLIIGIFGVASLAIGSITALDCYMRWGAINMENFWKITTASLFASFLGVHGYFVLAVKDGKEEA